MEILADLLDDEFEYQGITHERMISRGVIFDSDFNVYILKLHGKDDLGDRNYYELPGGGVENDESISEAFIREIKEETGYIVEIVSEIGIVNDYYNILKRKNINHYFLGRIIGMDSTKYTEFENNIIEKIVKVNISKAIELFTNNMHGKLGNLVKNRELRILIKAKEIMEDMYGNKSI